jgi:50S ribosomal protein L16 3-hydroxylase
VALERCFTYSIGFRAPRGAELGASFLDWLHERGLPPAEYRDPGLVPARHPGEIPARLVEFARSVLERIRWSRRDVERFLGEYLSEPKPHVVFTPPARGRPIGRSRVHLDNKTRLLYRGGRFYINGESVAVRTSGGKILRELADRRAAEGARLAAAGLAGLISKWHRLGYVSLERI